MSESEPQVKRSVSRRRGCEGRRLVDKAAYYGKAIGLIVAGAAYFGTEAYDKLVASKEAEQVRELVQKNKDAHIRLLQEQVDALKREKEVKP